MVFTCRLVVTIASRAMLGPAKLIGVSLHTVTEAEVINPSVVDYAIAGPTFETPSKPGYGPRSAARALLGSPARRPYRFLPSGDSMPRGPPKS
jgi:Thiamine monophosphate synthase